MMIPQWCFQGVLKRMVLLSIIAVPLFAQDLLAQTLNISPSTLPQATRGVPYNVTFSVTGGVMPY